MGDTSDGTVCDEASYYKAAPGIILEGAMRSLAHQNSNWTPVIKDMIQIAQNYPCCPRTEIRKSERELDKSESICQECFRT